MTSGQMALSLQICWLIRCTKPMDFIKTNRARPPFYQRTPIPAHNTSPHLESPGSTCMNKIRNAQRRIKKKVFTLQECEGCKNNTAGRKSLLKMLRTSRSLCNFSTHYQRSRGFSSQEKEKNHMYSRQLIGPNFPCAATILRTRDLAVFTQFNACT